MKTTSTTDDFASFYEATKVPGFRAVLLAKASAREGTEDASRKRTRRHS